MACIFMESDVKPKNEDERMAMLNVRRITINNINKMLKDIKKANITQDLSCGGILPVDILINYRFVLCHEIEILKVYRI